MSDDPTRKGLDASSDDDGDGARAGRGRKMPLQELLKGAWAAAHGLAQDAEQEARRLTERLAELADVPRGEAERLALEVRDRFRDNREQLECRVDEEVRAYLSRLRFPSMADLQAMTSHVDGLEARVRALERRRR